MTRIAKKKVTRVRKVVEKPTQDKQLTKSEITRGAGRVQVKIDGIVKNHGKAQQTAQRRIDAKYRKLANEELAGLHPQVLDALELPSFLPEPTEQPEETLDVTDIATDDEGEVAAQ